MNTQLITSLSPGHWQCHDYGQRPVEGTAVYEYKHRRHWFNCEAHGAWIPAEMTAPPCEHIKRILEQEAK